MADETQDRGPEFDRVRIGRPATGALIDAGYEKLADLPERLDSLLSYTGWGLRRSVGSRRRAAETERHSPRSLPWL